MRTYSMSVEHRGTSGEIRQSKLQCDHCNADLFDDACGKLNRRAWVRFQKEVEGVPTGPQIRALRRDLGLSSEMAGALLGGGPKAFSKYENEEIVPRGAMRTLVRYLLKYPHRIDEILEANGHARPARAVPPTVVLLRPDIRKVPREAVRSTGASLAAETASWLSFFDKSFVAEPVEGLATNASARVGSHKDITSANYRVMLNPYATHSLAEVEEVEMASEDQVIGRWAATRGAAA